MPAGPAMEHTTILPAQVISSSLGGSEELPKKVKHEVISHKRAWLAGNSVPSHLRRCSTAGQSFNGKSGTVVAWRESELAVKHLHRCQSQPLVLSKWAALSISMPQ